MKAMMEFLWIMSGCVLGVRSQEFTGLEYHAATVATAFICIGLSFGVEKRRAP